MVEEVMSSNKSNSNSSIPSEALTANEMSTQDKKSPSNTPLKTEEKFVVEETPYKNSSSCDTTSKYLSDEIRLNSIETTVSTPSSQANLINLPEKCSNISNDFLLQSLPESQESGESLSSSSESESENNDDFPENITTPLPPEEFSDDINHNNTNNTLKTNQQRPDSLKFNPFTTKKPNSSTDALY